MQKVIDLMQCKKYNKYGQIRVERRECAQQKENGKARSQQSQSNK
nr:MAG TPA: hypothetical protein [Caudoviricetes sp.]